jgi:hypothetical protein
MENQNIEWERKLTITEFENLKHIIKNITGCRLTSFSCPIDDKYVIAGIEILMQYGKIGAGCAVHPRVLYLFYDTPYNIFTDRALYYFRRGYTIPKDTCDKFFNNAYKGFYLLFCSSNNDGADNCISMFDVVTMNDLCKHNEGKIKEMYLDIENEKVRNKTQEMLEKYVLI